jgi:superoxide reductase
MQIIEPNTTEASIEKHLPTYEIKNNNIIIKINHIMEEKHYIEWISVINNEEIYTKKLTSNDKPKLIYPYKEGTIIYSYCNLHGLWKQEVK